MLVVYRDYPPSPRLLSFLCGNGPLSFLQCAAVLLGFAAVIRITGRLSVMSSIFDQPG